MTNSNISEKPPVGSDEETTLYERGQSFNAITRFLHGFRFEYLIEAIRALNFDRKIRIVEVGCAHGKAYELLDSHFDIDFVGIELDEESSAAAQERFGGRDNFTLLKGSVDEYFDAFEGADVVIALETLEHLPERLSFRVVERVAEIKPRLFFVSVPNEVGPMILIKNVGSMLMRYKRHKFYKWSETFNAGRYRLDKLPPHITMHRGFDWRWLNHTLIHFMHVKQYLCTPAKGFPRMFSPTIVFLCEPYTEMPDEEALRATIL